MKKAPLKIAIITLLAAALLIGGVLYHRFTNRPADEETEPEPSTEISEVVEEQPALKDNSANLDFDFAALEADLNSALETGYMPLISHCEVVSEVPGYLPEIATALTEVSTDTVSTVITKLKSADSLEQGITFSWSSCPPRSVAYYVSTNDPVSVNTNSVFSLFYADAADTLLLGYRAAGYAFHFSSPSDLTSFLESL